MNEWEWRLLEDKSLIDQVEIDGRAVHVGDRVRLRPRTGGDVFDLALAGQIATIEALEQDYEGKVHVCVVLDDDPGRDLGLLRQPGHRFFFDVDEIEVLPPEQQTQTRRSAPPRILVAGIGNIFMGDDAFGVEVARRLSQRTLPAGVRVSDFGIRGFDLAYALQDGYETTILIDACPRGEEPGTLFVVEPDLAEISASAGRRRRCRRAQSRSAEDSSSGGVDGLADEARAAGRLRAGNARTRRRRNGIERTRFPGSRGSGQAGGVCDSTRPGWRVAGKERLITDSGGYDSGNGSDAARISRYEARSQY